MNIFIIGFMASGKSSVGRRLASQLDFDFIDSDAEIEKQCGKNISEIFEQDGEVAFREMETKFLFELETENTVISLGGGTPCSKQNLELIQSRGRTVYLTLPAKAIVDRLNKSKNRRPLLEGFRDKPDELLSYVQSKLAEREEYYLQADIHLDALSIDAEKLSRIAQLIQLP